jgi:hypothetical protein
MESIIQWVLTRFTEGWAGIELIAQWADQHVLAAIFFGFLFRELARFIVKKTPTRYDDIGLEIIEDAIAGAFQKVAEAKSRMISGKKGK